MTSRVSVPRGGRWRRTEADSLLRLQRSDVERQARHQEKTDEIDRNGLRRRGRPLHKAFDPCCRWVFFFHGEVFLETDTNWKVPMGRARYPGGGVFRNRAS